MKTLTLPYLTDQQKQSVLKIWNAEYPVKLQMHGMQDLDSFLNTLINQKHYLLMNEADEIAGWACLYSFEMIRCFFIMLTTAIQGKGYGTLLLNELKKEEKQLFGWAIDHDNDVKANGKSYPSPLNFYRKNDFSVNHEIRLETERLSAVNIVWNTGTNPA